MEKPLAGVRVLSLEQAAALPFASKQLADLGADVIRAQSHLRTPAYIDPANIDLIRSKRQLGLDLTAEGGPELFLRLAAESDVVAHNFTPRVVRRFGIDYESVRRVNPNIIYVSLTGFGTTGPWGERPLFGPGAEAVSGHDLLIGTSHKWPGRPGTIVYADNTCGLYTTFAILAALEERDRGGGGRFIDISLYETAVSHLGPVLAERSLGADPARCGNDDRRFGIHGVFDARGHDRHVAIAAASGDEGKLSAALGIERATPDAVAATVREREADEIVSLLQKAGIAASLVADASDVLRDEQLWARGYFATIRRDIGHGPQDYPHSGPPWGGGSAVRFREPGPAGCDSEAVLRDVGEADDDEIKALFERGVVGQAPPAPPPPRAADAVRIERGEVSRVDADPAWGPPGGATPAADIQAPLGPAPGSPPARIDSPGRRRPRALDVSAGIAAAYSTRLLADAGWDVVRAELPGATGLEYRESRWGGGAGGAFAALHAGKRTVRLDTAGRLPALAAAADIVVGDFSPRGVAAARLPDGAPSGLEPGLAVVSVSPFGRTGPKAGWAVTELTMEAASGLMFLTGEYDQRPMQLPPYQAELTGGVAGACAAIAAAYLARRTGIRQKADVAIVEAMASHTYQSMAAYAYRGNVLRREARVKAGLRMVPASDGFVYCAAGALATQRMDGLARLIDEPRLNEERFQTAEGRIQNYDELMELFVPPFRARTAKEWFEAAEELHLTFALVQTVDDLFSCPQLAARGLLRDEATGDGRGVRIPGRPFVVTHGAESKAAAGRGTGTVEAPATLDWLRSPNNQGVSTDDNG